MSPKMMQNKKQDINKKNINDSDIDSDSENENKKEKKPIVFEEEKNYFDTNVYPPCYKITKEKSSDSIFQTTNNVVISENMEYPSFEYGFHHFVHQCKNYLNDETKKFEGRKKVWNVLNRYEMNIDNYTQSIPDIAKSFFSDITKVEIVNSSFYKTWEMYTYFDIVDTKKENFTSAHLFDGTGNFSQSTILFRDLFCKKNLSKNDKCNLFDSDEKIRNIEEVSLDKKISEYYEKEKRIINNKKIELKQKCDFVSADGNFDKLNENFHEKESPKLLTYEILCAIKLLKKDGVFVCKFFETFTKTSIKLITMLTEMFDEVYFIKPLMSKLSSNEKYAVCLNFKFSESDKQYKTMLDSIEKLYDKMNKLGEKENIVNIFADYKIPKNMENIITYMNISIANYNFKQIGKIVKFIRNQVYSGEEYHLNRDEQIEGTKYWTSLYFDNDKEKIKEKTKKIIEKSIENSIKNTNFISKNKEDVK
jgi:hypothetical protein